MSKTAMQTFAKNTAIEASREAAVTVAATALVIVVLNVGDKIYKTYKNRKSAK